MFTLIDGAVIEKIELKNDYVPQKVRHGDDTWDAQNKIFRHIEDHLHRHLAHVGKEAGFFAKLHKIDAIIIGSHKPLFSKIEKHLLYPLPEKVKGRFITELKVPFSEILARTTQLIKEIEEGEEIL